MNEFVYPLRVYYEDTDCGRVVYHSNYINFMERARSEWMIKEGFGLDVIHALDAFFAVQKINIDFIKPAKLYDALDVVCSVVEIKNASCVMRQKIRSSENKNLIYANAEIKLVCVNSEFKPRAIPNEIRESLNKILV